MPLSCFVWKFWNMKASIRIEPAACILGTLLLLTVPLNWLFSALIAAVFHELCHITALRLFKHRIWNVRIGIGGTSMETEPLSRGIELICAVAGPLGSFLLLTMIRLFPRTAICASVQGIYNLLPIYPSDGGRIFRCIAEYCLPIRYVDTVCQIAENTTIVSIFLILLIISFCYPLGLFPIILTAGFGLRMLRRKIPCKPSQLRVQ